MKYIRILLALLLFICLVPTHALADGGQPDISLRVSLVLDGGITDESAYNMRFEIIKGFGSSGEVVAEGETSKDNTKPLLEGFEPGAYTIFWYASEGYIIKDAYSDFADILNADFSQGYAGFNLSNTIDMVTINLLAKEDSANYDAALRKSVFSINGVLQGDNQRMTDPPLPAVREGDVIVYGIELFNQGNRPFYLPRIVDQSANGMIFNSSLPENEGWSLENDILVYTGLQDTLIEPGGNRLIKLTQTVSNAAAEMVINAAEIGVILDIDKNSVADSDSMPDEDPGNDIFEDNVIDLNSNLGLDEDDSDKAYLHKKADAPALSGNVVYNTGDLLRIILSYWY